MSFLMLLDDDVFQPLSFEEDDRVDVLDFLHCSSKCEAGLGRGIRLDRAEGEADECNGFAEVAIKVACVEGMLTEERLKEFIPTDSD